ncbi:MAG: hypothetical protein ABR543_10265 [Gemmatimonadaceae bacterium]
MRTSRSFFVATLLSLAAILSLGCDDSTGPQTGAIEVTVRSAGADIDPDGYSLTVGGRPVQAVGPNDAITIVGLPAGRHQVQLGGLAANCSVSSFNPVSVDVVSRDTVAAAFSVSCVAKIGNIQVTIATSGTGTDPDGYTLSVDGGGGQAVAPNAAFTFTGLSEGEHTLTLSGASANCTISPPNPRTVTVTFGATATAAFSVSCTARTGSIRVVTVTTGANLDPDGYSVYVDDSYYYYYGPRQNVATNGSVTFADIGEGVHTVGLDGIAANCTLAPPNPRTVSVAFNATVEVTFAIQCSPVGSVQVTTTTTGVDLDPNGYTFTVQAANFGAGDNVPANGTVTVSGLLGGDYVVTIFGVAANCDIVSPNPRTVTVGTGSTTIVAFDVTCVALTQLAFVNGEDGNPEIYVINSNGTGATRLTNHAAADLDPAWSPDGGKIAFGSNRDGNREIYVMNANGSSLVRLTNVTAADYGPTWSHDGARIAFVSERDGNAEIYVMNADGTNPVRLTTNTAYDADPAWSPDGSRIAFRSLRDGNPEIYVMNADGSGVAARLTNNVVNDAQPAWSPDRTKIAFSRGDPCCSINFIFVMNSDGSGLTQLTRSFSDDTDPTWSPDGRKIAFAAYYCDYYYGCFSDIKVVRSDGTGLTDVTFGKASNPAWRP